MILAHLLRRYEPMLPPGQGQSVNQVADDNIFPDMKAVRLIRRRKGIGAN